MAKLRFPEVVATNGNDNLFVGSNQLTFCLNGNDRIMAQMGSEYNFMAGGEGNDTYVAADYSAITIFDTGGSDTLIADGLGAYSPNTYVATVEGQHLIAVDLVSGQQVAVANWLNPENAIEQAQLSDGVYTLNELVEVIANSPNFLGDVSTSDLVSVGVLPPGTSSTDLQEFVSYIEQREGTILETQDTLGLAGVSWVEAREYVFGHLEAPAQILAAVNEVGLTTEMLASLVGVQQQEVVAYSNSHGLDASAHL